MSYRLTSNFSSLTQTCLGRWFFWRCPAPAATLAWTSAGDAKHGESQDLLPSSAAGEVSALHYKTLYSQLLQGPHTSDNDLVCHKRFDSSHTIHKVGQIVWTNHEAPTTVNKDRGKRRWVTPLFLPTCLRMNQNPLWRFLSLDYRGVKAINLV